MLLDDVLQICDENDLDFSFVEELLNEITEKKIVFYESESSKNEALAHELLEMKYLENQIIMYEAERKKVEFSTEAEFELDEQPDINPSKFNFYKQSFYYLDYYLHLTKEIDLRDQKLKKLKQEYINKTTTKKKELTEEEFREQAEMFCEGGKVDFPPDKMFDLISKKAAKGSVSYKILLGICFFKGLGTELDYSEAYKSFKSASIKGAYMAKKWEGICLLNGYGIEKNVPNALKILKFADISGIEIIAEFFDDRKNSVFLDEQKFDNNINVRLGIGYRELKDYDKALSFLNKANCEFNGKAAYLLGCMYRDGVGVPKNLLKAKNLFEEAIKRDYYMACRDYLTLKKNLSF